MFKLKPENLLLLFLVLTGALLRFYYLDIRSLSNDELSALSRLQVNSFRELITVGVTPDYHPAGIQVLLWLWTKIAGTSPFAVRFLFALMGTLSIIPAYLIGKKWFGIPAGLLTASFIAFAAFPLLYSQIARPYSSGMFFILGMVYFWDKIIFRKQDSRKTIIGFVLFTVLCMYDHYFCFLTAIIIGLTGLAYLNGTRLLKYLMAGGVAVLLFLPHIGITLEQVSRGGLSSWLGPPPPTSLIDFIHYTFNESWWLLFLVILVTIYISGRSREGRGRFRFISLIWFLLVWAIAHFYSIYVNPVFQYSILIFPFPFLILFVFSFARPVLNRRTVAGFGVVTIALIVSTIFINGYYTKKHFGEFKALAKQIEKWNRMLGEERITYTANVNGPYYIQYYLSNNQKFKIYDFDNTGKSLADYKEIVRNSTTPYFAHAWSTKFNPYETEGIIRDHYPLIISKFEFPNAGITLYGRGVRESNSEFIFLETNNEFEKPVEGWETPKQVNDSVSVSGHNSVVISQENQYGPAYITTLNLPDSVRFITASVNFIIPENSLATLVVTIERNGENIDWYGLDLEHYAKHYTGWADAFLTHRLPDKLQNGDKLKVYVWHRGGDKVLIDDMRVTFKSKS